MEVGQFRHNQIDMIEVHRLNFVIHLITSALPELDVLQDDDANLRGLAADKKPRAFVFLATGGVIGSMLLHVVVGVGEIAFGQQSFQASRTISEV